MAIASLGTFGIGIDSEELLAPSCPPEDMALKSLFLGPRSENGEWLRAEVDRLLDHWFRWRTTLFPQDPPAISTRDRQSPEFLARQQALADGLEELISRLESEAPWFSPRYLGHMVSELSLPALLGHLAAVLHNPNLVCAEVAPVAEVLEREAIGGLLGMVGFDPALGRGHFTSGGTVANIEALWRARYRWDHWHALGITLRERAASNEPLHKLAACGWSAFADAIKAHGLAESDLRPSSLVLNNPWLLARRIEALEGRPFTGPVVLVPRNKHYSWHKAVSLLGLGEEAFWQIDLDERGTLQIDDLRHQLDRADSEGRSVLMVVSVAGTTEMGEIDPVDRVQDLLDSRERERGLYVWHHVDAAYGGFFASLLPNHQTRSVLGIEAQRALEAMRRANSLTIDPHKLGYVPYSCGAILVRDAADYQVSQFSAPYLDTVDSVRQPAREPWRSTLEGSRPATGAAATWLTMKTLGLGAEGCGRVLARTVRARQRLEHLLASRVEDCQLVPGCDTNILCFFVARPGEALSTTNERTRQIIAALGEGDRFFVSKTRLDRQGYRRLIEGLAARLRAVLDEPALEVVRVVLMNPFTFTREPEMDYLAMLADRIAAVTAQEPAGSV